MTRYWQEKRACKECGKVFTPRASNQVYCKPECGDAALRLRYGRQYGYNAWIIFNRDRFQCIYCGRTSFSDKVVLHVDHIIPHSAGGKDEACNLVTACAGCNTSKCARHCLNEDEILAEVRHRNEVVEIDPNWMIKL